MIQPLQCAKKPLERKTHRVYEDLLVVIWRYLRQTALAVAPRLKGQNCLFLLRVPNAHKASQMRL